MIPSALQAIPDDLRQKLEKLRPYLERTGGSIQPRKRYGVYCLRIRVAHPRYGRVHRRVTIGDEATAFTVQTVIDAWRREYDTRHAEQERPREQEDAYNSAIKGFRQELLAQASGPSQRCRLAREFDEAAKNPMEMYF
jgi:hypothetical protein